MLVYSIIKEHIYCGLIGYSDSDFAACKLDRKSTSGTYHIFGNSLVSWYSKKQVLFYQPLKQNMWQLVVLVHKYYA